MERPQPDRHPTFRYLDHPPPIAYAHRGGAGEGEENTAAAFENAVQLGYTYLETDVQATRDGVAVLFHDPTLERVTEAHGPVASWSWAELKQVRTRKGQRLMRLDELLAAWPDQRVTVELKSDAAIAPAAETLSRCDAVHRVCAGSFRTTRVKVLRRLVGPHLCWSPSYAGVFRLWLAGQGLAVEGLPFPVVQIPVHYKGVRVLTRGLIGAAHARGIQVHVWTVNTRHEMEALLDMGVDGLMSDYPGLLRKVLEERGLWHVAQRDAATQPVVRR